jgi:hypothetical protein
MLYAPLVQQPQLLFTYKTLCLTYKDFLQPQFLSRGEHIVSVSTSSVNIETCAAHLQGDDISCTEEKSLHIFLIQKSWILSSWDETVVSATRSGRFDLVEIVPIIQLVEDQVWYFL